MPETAQAAMDGALDSQLSVAGQGCTRSRGMVTSFVKPCFSK